VSLQDLYERYSDRVEFLTVYIREAHPIDGWWLGGGVLGSMLKIARSRAATDLYDPKTLEERQAVAGRCENELGYQIRTLVDSMDDAVNQAYAAWPTRLYLIGEDGRVVYAGGLGPYRFSPAELGRSIKKHLNRSGDNSV
jgi:hypothetical protein